MTAVKGHHVAGTGYNWRHGYVPLNAATAARWHKPFPGTTAKPSRPGKPRSLQDSQAFLREYYAGWRENLTPAEERGLRFYQSPGFALMNGQLRGLDPEELKRREHASDADLRRAKQATADLRKAISKAPPLSRDLEVYRGFDANQFGDLRAGQEITDPAFVSTSLTNDAGAVGRAGEHATAVVRLPRGTRLAGGSARELILPPDSRFRVISATRRNGRLQVELELVHPTKELANGDHMTIDLTARTAIASTVHQPTVKPGGPGLFHMKGAQLPAYIQHVANELKKQGKDESRAVAMAIGIVRNWSQGRTGKGGHVSPEVQAAAKKAIAEWNALRAKAKAIPNKGHEHTADATSAVELGWDEAAHPRVAAGLAGGGRFAAKTGSASRRREGGFQGRTTKTGTRRAASGFVGATTKSGTRKPATRSGFAGLHRHATPEQIAAGVNKLRAGQRARLRRSMRHAPPGYHWGHGSQLLRNGRVRNLARRVLGLATESPTSAGGRRKLAKQNKALKDDSYPIPNVTYLKKAIKAYGRAPAEKRAKVRALIRRRARELGRTDLIPASWGGSAASMATGVHDFPLMDLARKQAAGTRPTPKAPKPPKNKSGHPTPKLKIAKMAYHKLRRKGASHEQAARAATKFVANQHRRTNRKRDHARAGDAEILLAAVNGHHVPGTAYHWWHDYHPRDAATAKRYRKKNWSATRPSGGKARTSRKQPETRRVSREEINRGKLDESKMGPAEKRFHEEQRAKKPQIEKGKLNTKVGPIGKGDVIEGHTEDGTRVTGTVISVHNDPLGGHVQITTDPSGRVSDQRKIGLGTSKFRINAEQIESRKKAVSPDVAREAESGNRERQRRVRESNQRAAQRRAEKASSAPASKPSAPTDTENDITPEGRVRRFEQQASMSSAASEKATREDEARRSLTPQQRAAARAESMLTASSGRNSLRGSGRSGVANAGADAVPAKHYVSEDKPTYEIRVTPDGLVRSRGSSGSGNGIVGTYEQRNKNTHVVQHHTDAKPSEHPTKLAALQHLARRQNQYIKRVREPGTAGMPTATQLRNQLTELRNLGRARAYHLEREVLISRYERESKDTGDVAKAARAKELLAMLRGLPE